MSTETDWKSEPPPLNDYVPALVVMAKWPHRVRTAAWDEGDWWIDLGGRTTSFRPEEISWWMPMPQPPEPPEEET